MPKTSLQDSEVMTVCCLLSTSTKPVGVGFFCLFLMQVWYASCCGQISWLGEILEQACSGLGKFTNSSGLTNSYLDYSIFVKCLPTSFCTMHSKNCASLWHTCRWKIKLQCRWSVSTSDGWAGKHCHILQKKSSVLGMLTPSRTAQSCAGISLRRHVWIKLIGSFEKKNMVLN